LRWSLHKTATELLYVPMSPRLRAAVKEVSDVVAQRGGQAIGSLLILAWLAAADSERWLGPILIAGAGAWVVLAFSLRAPYLRLFRDTLSESLVETRLDFPELDVASLETLMAALNSPDDNRVLAALDLLGATGRVHVIPALILYHPSVPVVERALELFAIAGRDDVESLSGRLLAHGDGAVRAAATRALAWVRPDGERLRRAAASTCPLVAATALIASAAHGSADGAEVLAKVQRYLAESSGYELPRAVARALRDFPVAAFGPLLTELARTADAETRCDTARAMGQVRDEQHLPVLIDLLAQREVREAARMALLAYGDTALMQLQRALEDFTLPYEVRVHVPRTISRFGHQRAMDLLLRHLLVEPGGMVRYKILRGLGRMRADVPNLQLDDEVVSRVVDDHLAKTFPLVHWRMILNEGAAQQPARRTPGHALLADLLRQKEAFAIERLFRVLGLRDPNENFAQLYEGLQSPDAAVRASSRELLEHTLAPRWRAAVVGLIDEGNDTDRLAAAGSFYEPEPIDYDGLLALLLDHHSDTLSALAAYHAREIGLSCGSERQYGPDTQASPASRRRWLELLFAGNDARSGGLRNVG
jgi:HEAT repeat protein